MALDVKPSVSSARNIDLESSKVRLCQLLRQADGSHFAAGDLLIEMTESKASLKELATITGWSVSRLSEIRATAKAFPKDERIPGVPFHTFERARHAATQVNREIKKILENNPPEKIVAAINKETQTPKAALNVILAHEKATNKKPDKRKAMSLIASTIYDKMAAATAVPKPIQDDPFLNRCHFMDCVALVNEIVAAKPTWLPKLIHLDPPYGAYKKFKDGHHDVGTSAARMTGSSNPSCEEAVATTVEVIKRIAPLIQPTTVVLLWQSAIEVRLPILQAIDEAGLEIEIPVIWDKSKAQPGDFASAWSQQAEFCWVIKKKGADAPLNHDGNQKTRGNVLSSRDPRFQFAQSASAIHPTHVWKKPVSMMEFLIRKHTYPGEVVMDLYGCTGSCSIAAANLGRRFVYCESFKENFETFSPDVERALVTLQAQPTHCSSSSLTQLEVG